MKGGRRIEERKEKGLALGWLLVSSRTASGPPSISSFLGPSAGSSIIIFQVTSVFLFASLAPFHTVRL